MATLYQGKNDIMIVGTHNDVMIRFIPTRPIFPLPHLHHLYIIIIIVMPLLDELG